MNDRSVFVVKIWLETAAEEAIVPTTITRDPICGMEMDAESAGSAYEYAGWTYLFCSTECMEIFVRAPRECVLYLAHNRSGHLGYACERQRSEREWYGTLNKTEVKGLFR